ncbi:hypothetical protein [Paenibacillus sp. YN15]|uniref:hypothetical protein n=1 Tax=Paenibacillus sp. YN15 TaxID=1742774 RepID=UPI000DCF15DA|nr:hypothetical protein [Paenibacillus sp. YN15]RAV05512.1 hypothetical protein DQG13_02500 [Paenibacillus sp. YN15]
MKFNKKTVTVLSFTLGATLFLSTAFADALIGSGYDQLKSSIKTTSSQMEAGLSNYTMEAMYAMKDNGETFMEVSQRTKFDNAAQATENTTVTQYAKGEPIQQYSYSDTTRSIWKGNQDDTYYVTEYAQPRAKGNPYQDPFKEQGAAELEKVFDAVVGNLKDYVQAENRTDGGKTYTASLSEAQVPALVNAIASFGFKQLLTDEGRSNREVSIPQMDSDIYVKKMTGVASQQKDGVLENMTGELVLSGKAKDGSVHDLSVSVTVRLTAVGETKIVLPDLTNASVTKAEESDYGFSTKYVGKYKNDIVLEKNGQFVKAGERLLEITSVERDHMAGTYTETVIPGFEAELGEPLSFTFTQEPDREKGPSFAYTLSSGEKGTIQLFPNGLAKVYMNIYQDATVRGKLNPGLEVSVWDKRMDTFNGEFIRIFE